ncbi:MAG: glycogen/starch/alpha-glucan phosphorylase, partial [Desulfobacterales bacterium]|nr:glycogen/starch/alpha-glucan phosphorylase [Desulfobacterales bacterium]
GYNPRKYYEENDELKEVLDMIDSGYFSPNEPHLFKPIVSSLLDQGDYYLVLADFKSYALTQKAVGKLYQDRNEWTRRSILNTANMGKFSSDRSVLDYARDIWDATPVAK